MPMFRSISSPMRRANAHWARAARSVNGVCAILIGDDHDELEGELAAGFPQSKLVANEVVAHDDLCKVIRFVDKPTKGLDLTLDMRGTALQRRVWEKLRAIPVGRTYTPDSGQSLSVVGISAQCHKRPPCIVAKSDA